MFGCQLYIYRPPTKLWEGNVFTPVCHSVQWEVVSPLGGDSLDGEPLLDIVYPWTEIVPGQRPPWTETPPGLTSSGGHRSGRYASYWNAYLFAKFSENLMKLTNLWWIGNGRPITSPMWVVQARKGKLHLNHNYVDGLMLVSMDLILSQNEEKKHRIFPTLIYIAKGIHKECLLSHLLYVIDWSLHQM